MFFEGTAGGHVSKYDSIEAGNAVNDGNWRANVIINVRLANVIIVVISWGENLVTMRLRNGATCIHLISLQFNYWNTHTAHFHTLHTFTHCTMHTAHRRHTSNTKMYTSTATSAEETQHCFGLKEANAAATVLGSR